MPMHIYTDDNGQFGRNKKVFYFIGQECKGARHGVIVKQNIHSPFWTDNLREAVSFDSFVSALSEMKHLLGDPEDISREQAIPLDGAYRKETEEFVTDNRDVVQLLVGGKRSAVLN